MRALVEGDRITHRAGRVLIVLLCVRPGAAYRVSVAYGSTGAEIPELSRSWPSEDQARAEARAYAQTFTDGRTVDQHLRPVPAGAR